MPLPRPPPPPTTTPPLLPPPPLSEPPPPPPPKGPAPLVPRFLLSKTVQNQKLSQALSLEERKKQEKLWDDRIKLFSACAHASENLQTLREELGAATSLAHSTFIQLHVDEEKKAAVEAQHVVLQTRVDEERSALQDLKAGVVRFEASVSTPVPTPASTPLAGTHSRSNNNHGLPPLRKELTTEEREQHREVRTHLELLSENVARVRAMLEEVREARASELQLANKKRRHAKQEENGGLEDDTLSGSLPSVPFTSAMTPNTRKRRADEVVEGPTRDNNNGRSAGKRRPPIAATPEDVQSVRDLLKKCAQSISEAHSDLVNMPEDARDVVAGILDVKLQDIRDQKKAAADAKKRVHQQEQETMKVEVQEGLKELAERTAGIDEQLAEVSGALIGLVQQTGQIEEEVEHEKKQSVEGHSRLDQLREKLQAMKKTQESHASSLASLHSDMDAATEETANGLKRPTSPPPPTGPLEHPAVHALLESVTPAMADAVRLKVDEMREAMKGALSESSAELYKRFWQLTQPTRAMIWALENAANNARLQSGTSDSQDVSRPVQAASADVPVDVPPPSANVPQATAPPVLATPVPTPAAVPASFVPAAPSPDIILLPDSPPIKQEPVEIWPLPSVQSASAALHLSSSSTMRPQTSRPPPATAPPVVINVDKKPTPAHDCSFLADPRVQGLGVRLQPPHKNLVIPYIFVRTFTQPSGPNGTEQPWAVVKNQAVTKNFLVSDLRYVVPTNRRQYVLCTAPGEDHGQLFFVQSYHGEVCIVRKHPKPHGDRGQIQMSTRSLAQVCVPRANAVKTEVVDD